MMRNQSRWLFWRAYEIVDVLLVLVCFVGSYIVYQSPGSLRDSGALIASQIRVSDALWIGLLCILWHLILIAGGTYHNRRFSGMSEEMLDMAKAVVGMVTLYLLVGFLVGRTPVTLRFLLLFGILTTAVMIGFRLLVRALLIVLRRGHRNLRFVLIAGTNARAVAFADMITQRREMGFKLVGFCDDEWEGTEEFRARGYPLVASLQEVGAYVRHQVVDEVFIALPLGSHYTTIRYIVSVCEEQGIQVRYGADLFETKKLRPEPDHALRDIATIIHQSTSMIGWKAVIKRAFDLSVALIMLVLTLPVMIIAALAVKLTSPGPILFAQQRLGKNKRIFRMYKFRSMVQDAEKLQAKLENLNEAQGPVFKISRDPRVTAVGSFLRKTSIDELPQLLNVLKGDMSIIGPRPLPLRDYRGFENDTFRRRMSVLPGITCIWQASGRSNITFERWMSMDLAYIDHWTLKLDMKILAKTIVSVLRGTGAA